MRPACGVMQAFLNSSSVKAALNQTSSALAAISVLKRVCVHPALLSDRAAHQAARGGMLVDTLSHGHGQQFWGSEHAMARRPEAGADGVSLDSQRRQCCRPSRYERPDSWHARWPAGCSRAVWAAKLTDAAPAGQDAVESVEQQLLAELRSCAGECSSHASLSHVPK